MAALQLTSARQESQTFDEGFHLTAGFSYWVKGDFRLNREHPPLSKLAAALPLLFTGAKFPELAREWEDGNQYKLSEEFLYNNTVDADQLLFLGRLPGIAMTMALGLAVAAVARAYGPLPALLAVFFFATDPNLLAHGRYVTSDLPVALMIFLAAVTWSKALETRRRVHFALAALALGLALATKYSALFLLLAHPAAAAVQSWRARRPYPFDALALVTAGGLLVVSAVYLPETARALRAPGLGRLDKLLPEHTDTQKAAKQVARDFRLPAHSFLRGALAVIQHNEDGHRSYFLGKTSDRGSHWYFPVAFLVKTPTAVLAAGAAAVLLARSIPLLALYPVLYFALSMSSQINIGIRHLLPVYPFLFVAIAAAAARLGRSRWRRAALAAGLSLCLTQAVEVARISPYYLAFFNTLAGGPEAGRFYLADSNLDWGQDAKRLGQWMKANHVPRICASYFGSANLDYYGVAYDQIPAPPPEIPDCIAAVSVTNLQDVYTPPNGHAWARKRQPFAHIGHSIFLYDLRTDRNKR